MGARIAAHLANAGMNCWLLDVAPSELTAEEKARGLTLTDPRVRNRTVRAGLEAAQKARPAAFFTSAAANRITIGNFEDNLAWCAQADWVIEAVAENLAIKRTLLQKVAAQRRPGTIITTNTSGLPIHQIAQGFDEDFQRHWAGTHFFNPPRYMKLVELIPGPQTSPEILNVLDDFCDRRLGKGVVRAKDTPNFIANRIGTFSMLTSLSLMARFGMSIEEVDACTGPAIGWPKSATFRTADIVGLDVLANVVRNIYENTLQDESRDIYRLPRLVEEMMNRGWLGEKSGRGFYQRLKKGASTEILALDPATMEYRPRQKARFVSLEAARTIEDTRARLQAILAPMIAGQPGSPAHADVARVEVQQPGDKAQQFLWALISETSLYAARRVPEIADSIVDIDRAMRWGFGWELGPFEICDALGVESLTRRWIAEGRELPPLFTRLLSSGRKSLYESSAGETSVFDPGAGTAVNIPKPPGIVILKSLKERSKEVARNSGASLIDLGDGVLCCEFHSKMNAIDSHRPQALEHGLRCAHRRQSGAQFFRRCQSNAAPGRRPGAGMGRYPRCRAPLSERQPRPQARSETRRHCSTRNGARWRLRNLPAWRAHSGRGRSLHGARRDRRRPDPCRWRLQGNDHPCQ
jgi:3-hydroxyacyl-CoA dehydrogenase